MFLETPNYFDEIGRIRTSSLPYDPKKDYSLIIQQLREACRAFKYSGASPQNLVAPAELLPVIVVRQGKSIRTFINPQIEEVHGGRLQLDACGNIYLMLGNTKIFLMVMVRRPRQLKLSYFTPAGRSKEEWFTDPVRRGVWPQSVCSFICHESAHLRGELIVYNARNRLISLWDRLKEKKEQFPEAAFELIALAYKSMPLVLIRKGDVYVLHHGSELTCVPEATPDVVFFDGINAPYQKISEMKVPRDGQLLSIRFSKFVNDLLS